MGAYTTLKCPDCGYMKVYNGHGTCRCGAYLIKYWEGMYRHHRSLGLPFGRRCWGFSDDSPPTLLKGQE